MIAREAPPPVRGLWVVRHSLTSAQSIDEVVALAEELHFTDLFVQVRGRGDAYYRSRYEPLAEQVPPDFDPLEYLLQRTAHSRLRIHAWINVFYVWSREELPRSRSHPVYRKREWLVYPAHHDPAQPDTALQNHRSGEGLFQSPMNPEVQEYLIHIVDDILSHYPVAGLHLDYIRYPDSNVDLNPSARKAFKSRYIFDPAEFLQEPERFARTYGETGYEVNFSRWGKFLREGLSEFVRRLAEHVHHRYPGVILSAAVKPDLGRAHWRYYQEWDRWVREGWLDRALPMNYTPDLRLFLYRTRTMVKAAGVEKLIMGISLYNQSPASVAEKIRAVQELPLAGFVLFSYTQLQENPRLRAVCRQLLENHAH